VNSGKTIFLGKAQPYLIALFALVLTAAPAAWACSAGTVSAFNAELATPHRSKLKGVPQFGEVTPMVFRGGHPTPEGLKALAGLGVKVVIDLRGTDKKERRRAHALGMQYIAMPWHCPFPHNKTFASFLAVMRENRDKKVFVHCRLGDDRTGMMIAAYRMAEQGWTPKRAAKEMRAYGFSPLHHLICPSLAGYEKNFPQLLKTDPVFRHPPPPEKE